MRLTLPLVSIAMLAAASPAAAADWDVDATANFSFAPGERRIAVGDTVIWTFEDSGHTTTARRGQAESWSSGPETSPAGATFRHTFDTPGRFQYVCLPHRPYMSGVIQVGEDEEPDTLRRLRTKPRGRRVKLVFALNEPATATYRLRGPKRRTVKRGRLEVGRNSLTVRRLPEGRYRGRLILTDDFDKKLVRKNSFRIR